MKKPLVETITVARPTLRDNVYLFPQEWDVPAVIGRNNVGWTFVDLRHLDAPAKYRLGALLADGRVVLPAMLWFKTEAKMKKAIGEFQRPMAAEVHGETFLVEVALLRSRFERGSAAANLVDDLADVVKATVEGRVGAEVVLA
jgi:hypothetical protein